MWSTKNGYVGSNLTRWILPEKLGGGARPASQNHYPVYDQNLPTLYMACLRPALELVQMFPSSAQCSITIINITCEGHC